MKVDTEPSIRLPDGTIFVGHFHADAMERASAAGYADSVIEQAGLGFSNTRGTTFQLAGATFIIEGL